VFTRDVLLLTKPTAAPHSTLICFSFWYHFGRDVIRADDNNHIPPGSGAMADRQSP
jgi:hypothetical protein